MRISKKRTFSLMNNDDETLSSKKPRLKLLATKSALVGNKEKLDEEEQQLDGNEDASGDNEDAEEEYSSEEDEDGQSNEQERGIGEEDQHESSLASPSPQPMPTVLICHCGHPADMKQSLHGLPRWHNRHEWFGTCASGSCDYWRWANESGQQHFSDDLDNQTNTHSDAESEGEICDEEDNSGIDASDDDNHLVEPPIDEMLLATAALFRSTTALAVAVILSTRAARLRRRR